LYIYHLLGKEYGWTINDINNAKPELVFKMTKLVEELKLKEMNEYEKQKKLNMIKK